MTETERRVRAYFTAKRQADNDTNQSESEALLRHVDRRLYNAHLTRITAAYLQSRLDERGVGELEYKGLHFWCNHWLRMEGLPRKLTHRQLRVTLSDLGLRSVERGGRRFWTGLPASPPVPAEERAETLRVAVTAEKERYAAVRAKDLAGLRQYHEERRSKGSRTAAYTRSAVGNQVKRAQIVARFLAAKTQPCSTAASKVETFSEFRQWSAEDSEYLTWVAVGDHKKFSEAEFDELMLALGYEAGRSNSRKVWKNLKLQVNMKRRAETP